MGYKETFFWYDLETFGLDAQHDRIAQFAGVRTDTDLKEIGEPVVLYCSLSDDYLPDPLAIKVTGITPQIVQQRGLPEKDFLGEINRLFTESNTCVVGFNSLRFDDEFIRNSFFRNFFDPYEREYKNGNSRFDILDLARATHDFRPEGIQWPVNKDTGYPSFKLTSLTEANDISHIDAHDALSDVYATLNFARLVKEKQPRLFSYFLTMRNKQTVKEKLITPFGPMVAYSSSQFISEYGSTRLILPITALTNNSNSVIAFDLSQDPSELIERVAAIDKIEQSRVNQDIVRKSLQKVNHALEHNVDLLGALESAQRALELSISMVEDLPDIASEAKQLLQTRGIVKISVNKVPFISPLSTVTGEVADRLHIDMRQCEKNYQKLRETENLVLNVLKAGNAQKYTTVDDVDFSLYSGSFLSSSDQERCRMIREMGPEKLKDFNPSFDDPRLHELLWRYRGRNYSEYFDQEEMKKWKSFCAQRIMKPLGRKAIDFSFFIRKVNENIRSKDVSPAEKDLYITLEKYGKELAKRIGIPYPEYYS
ncbi:MAG: exodeoxyribonuclease I [Sphaerochaetaceae bacterium]